MYFLQLSILVHPDKNQDDSERAQKAFDGESFTVRGAPQRSLASLTLGEGLCCKAPYTWGGLLVQQQEIICFFF